jgi:N-methylhydantoinase A/oxoprolinase/acetone carboxylase beta subunit
MCGTLAPKPSLRLGWKIGDTFTDLCIAGTQGVVAVGKLLTTTEEPASGVEAPLRDTLHPLRLEADALGQVVHGTTRVTSALLQRRAARVANWSLFTASANPRREQLQRDGLGCAQAKDSAI